MTKTYYAVFWVAGTGGGEFGTTTQDIYNINAYIQSLPNDAFKNNADNRKKALYNKLSDIFSKIESEDYQGAIDKLNNDIKHKVGDLMADDWIINVNAQQHIGSMVDELVNYLYTF